MMQTITHGIATAALLAAGLIATACGGADSRAAGYVVDRSTAGDTTVVHTRSGSAWGEPARLVEVVRIGTLDGADEYMFGSIGAIAPDLEGGVYVFDGQVPALRHYDSSGTYRRTLGARGGGPGEYQDVALGLAVRRDGSVLLRDPRNARINIYDRNGETIDHWPVASNLFAARAMVMDTAEHVYLKILLGQPRPNEAWPIGLLHLNDHGEIVDTIPDPPIAGEPTDAGGAFVPAKVWDWSPLGYPVVGVSSTYAFELRHPDGRVTRVRRDHGAVPVGTEERAEWEARNEWLRVNQGQFMTATIPPVPSVKPAYNALIAGEAGRIWVQRNMPAVKLPPEDVPEARDDQPPPLSWRAPVVFDVFESDGTYLGEVRVPDRTRLLVLGTEMVWGIRTGALDEQYVVGYRLDVRGR